MVLLVQCGLAESPPDMKIQIQESQHQNFASILAAVANAFNVGAEGRECFALKDKEQDLIITKLEDIAILNSKVLIFIHAGVEA